MESEKISAVVNDERLGAEQKTLLKDWAKHICSYKSENQALGYLYTLREFGLFVSKPFETADLNDVERYLQFKRESSASITGNRVLDVKPSSVSCYRHRVNAFYRWVLKHTGVSVDAEIAYPRLKLVKKPEKSREQLCKERVEKLLRGHISQDTGNDCAEANLRTLNDYYAYKFTSGKVESHTGFVGKLYFLNRLGTYLNQQGKCFKQATRESIQDFLASVQQGVVSKRFSNKKQTLNNSYKAHLLDFYRFVYEMFGEEQPRKYPEVVSWLYQGRKKSHQKIAKEIIPDSELKAMIEGCVELRDKALLALLADCSGRVGEIVNTCIKDVKLSEISAEGAKYAHQVGKVVLRGKTGERTNQLFYSVSYLRLWLISHPLKDNAEAPLFIATKECRYGQRLTSVGINKILQRAARRASVKRHIHAHLFRHTNLTKMARLLSESELKIHAGWGSDSKMASVYVHLNEQDVADKILEKYGIVKKEKESRETMLVPKICPNAVCSYQNPGEAQFCTKCGYPLSLKTAVSVTKIKKKEEELHTEIMKRGLAGVDMSKANDLRELMWEVVKKDANLLEKLKSIANDAGDLK